MKNLFNKVTLTRVILLIGIIGLLFSLGGLLLLKMMTPVTPPPIPAFPGAEGAGAATPGGRGGRIIEVTNLKDTGAGSLREAIATEGPKIIVFRVGGIIELEDLLRLDTPYTTVAGQTAPGGGITLKGTDKGEGNILSIQAHDVIIRYLRFRSGAHSEPGHGQVNIAIGSGSHNVIIDHVSTSWSLDENIDIHRNIPDEAKVEEWPEIYNITVQNSLLAEGLYPHSTGLRTGGEFLRGGWQGVHDLSIHHNLFASSSHRNPAIAALKVQVINNVIYNWGTKSSESSTASTVDWIGNYFKPGPLSDPKRLIVHNAFLKMNPEDKYPPPSIYITGNMAPPVYPDPAADNWPMYLIHYDETAVPETFRRYEPLPDPAIPITIQPASDAYESVLASIGANARLDCSGNWVPNMDAIDARLIANVREGTGSRGETIESQQQAQTGEGKFYETHITHEDEAGGYAPIEPGMACADTDHDGMPDEWEVGTGVLNSKVNDSAGYDLDASYTNIEVYLNGLKPISEIATEGASR